MSKYFKKIIISLILLVFLTMPFRVGISSITQDSAPYQTYTEGPNGLILTQTAYEPTGNLYLNTTLNNPEDFHLKDSFIYIADTGNKRVIKVDFLGDIHLEINSLVEPTGVHVDNLNNIYIADKGAKAVIKYDSLGNIIQEYSRPVEPLFGSKTPFEPLKVVSGPRDIIYIVGLGGTDGLVQLNRQGEFLGFFASNSTKKTFFGALADIFGVKYAKRTPVSADNLAIDAQGSIYTVSKTENQRIKKFNIASKVSLSIEHEMNLKDIKINSFGNIYTISDKGIINEYDSSGNLIFQFGALDQGNMVLGKFVNPVALEIDIDNNIYILDKGTSSIQILMRSAFAQKIHQGLINYADGIYDIAEWEEVLKMNGFFSLANKSIANALYRDDQYSEALYYFKIAQDRSGYSEAFWQVRYNWMQNYLPLLFGVIIGFFVLLQILKLFDKKYQIYNPIRKTTKKIKSYKATDEFLYMFRIMARPFDSAYALKKEKKASILSATLIYLAFVVVGLISAYSTAFIFNKNDLTNYSVLTNVLIQIGLILLFVVANHLISSLQSGEGFFKDIYITIAYALSPIILMSIPLMLLSHVLTLNEIFIYQAILTITWGYTFILMITMIKEIHNYNFKKLIVNLLLTFFTMLMILLVLFLVYLLSMQLFDYIESIIKEVTLRA